MAASWTLDTSVALVEDCDVMASWSGGGLVGAFCCTFWTPGRAVDPLPRISRARHYEDRQAVGR